MLFFLMSFRTMKLMKTIIPFIVLIFTFPLLRCKNQVKTSVSPLGKMEYPPNNFSSNDKIALGKQLFFDKRLSLNNEISCATCHIEKRALSDGRILGQGVLGRAAFRNTPSLYNVGYFPKYMFDAEISSLEEQILVPILDHNEMGASMKEVIEVLSKDSAYQKAARKIFKRDFDVWVLTRSIAAYERTFISDNSSFDKFYYQKIKAAMSESAKRGWKLFSGKLNCVKCHPAPFFTDFNVHNNGRTKLDNADLGRYRINNDSTEIGYFKTPSLRNVSITAPYMHDGSLKTIDDVIDYYASGGDHGYNQEKSINSFEISQREKEDLKNFLKSLEDF